MVQYSPARLDRSFAALSDATRRGVLEQLGRADASITDLAEKFHMSEELLKALNGGKALDQAGTSIVVASVLEQQPKAPAAAKAKTSSPDE